MAPKPKAAVNPRPVTEDDNPTWNQLRFTADTIARCFEDALGTQSHVRRPSLESFEKIAANVNRVMDRDHNVAHRVFETLDISKGKNVSLSEIQSELLSRVRDAGGRLYHALEEYSQYGGLEPDSPYAQLYDLLLGASMVSFTESRPRRPGHPREVWRSNCALFASWVAKALHDAGYEGNLDAKAAETPTAAVCAAMVSRAYGKVLMADDVADAIRKLTRNRSKRPTELDKIRANIRANMNRIRVLD